MKTFPGGRSAAFDTAIDPKSAAALLYHFPVDRNKPKTYTKNKPGCHDGTGRLWKDGQRGQTAER
jgi:hypothetical protein